MRSTMFSLRGLQQGLKPTLAWAPILALLIFSLLGALAGAGNVVRLGFPVVALLVGIHLYQRYPIHYVGFTWWLWFITPWLARIVDYRSGWDPQRQMLLAPFVVTFISGATLVRSLPIIYRQGAIPFLLPIAAVFYALFMGAVQYAPFSVIRAAFDWLPPMLFGFHLFINWRDYPKYRQNMQQVFVWGMLVIGTYGVIQYLIAPDWDRAWITNTGLVSFGKPEPLGIRVFSTLNSTGPFASVMMAGLLLLFSSDSPLRPAAAGAGYLALLLSLSRTAWGGWFVALLIHLSSLKSHLQMRLVVTIAVLGLVVLPLTAIEPFSSVIQTRLQTFSNLENDASFNARSGIYESGLDNALGQILGNGLGNITRTDVVDSGIIEMLLTLGWIGTIPYMGGILLMLFSVFTQTESRFDPFVSTARAICVSTLLQIVIATTTIGISGLILWGSFGLIMAAHKYYAREQTIQQHTLLVSSES
jgi:hypothetical protein